jgi:UDP-N-acetylmuramoyl-tripeptide--D-alanyl-D-alanine ligase
VPLTVLSAGTETDALIVEMGMRGTGQIAELCEVAHPTMGLITNVGTSHVELLGSVDAIAQAKGELAAAVPADGEVFVNGDDSRSDAMAARASAPVTRYGLSEDCEVRAVDIRLDALSRASFTLMTTQGSVSVSLPIPGRHNVYNALAAAALGLRLAVPLESVAEGLSIAEMSGMRMEMISAASGVTILNDAYNANPTSMRAAIETLADMSLPGRRVAVLGDMAELGTLTDLSHLEIGEFVYARGIDVLVTVGRKARRIAEGARVSGMDPDSVRPCATPDEAVEVLDDLIEPGDVVLVKASRVMGLEMVVEGLVDPRVG